MYSEARERYKKWGVDTEAAINTLLKTPLSIHCWQGDDVRGFEGSLGPDGGIAVTGNYPGAARGPRELMADIEKTLSLVAGRHRLNIHASYAITDGETVERDKLAPKHFQAWIDFAKKHGLGIDFNPTLFGHPMVKDGLTLSHPDEKIRRFWIDHCKASRRIAEHIGRELTSPCLCNIWIPDGFKDIPASRIRSRERLKASLDEIYDEKLNSEYIIDSVESKVFGIGVEACTVGSHEFYMNYAAQRGILCLLDNGHFHPTEQVSDKISSMLLFSDRIALHITRGVRWDSDHVIALDDELIAMCRELVSCDALRRAIIGLDFFDGSINRIAAWVIGIRNVQKALLYALLLPHKELAAMQDKGEFTKLLAMTEEFKSYPFSIVWEEFCGRGGCAADEAWLDEVLKYERDVLSKRG
jgi:L-rhamnose isomerase